ncbi:MAG: fused MFS/spermidine synthase [Elusimicrobia bacterium]|nr:fused MFS/spermidine synthase [Elusimicrobiota bacterium]
MGAGLTPARLRQAIAFLGSFLLFSIEVLSTKLLLPSFGGAAYVWTTSCMFFQAVLLAGYLYSEGVLRRMGAGRYARWHLGVLFAPLLFFPITLRLPVELSHPMSALLVCLTAGISIPFLVLSMTSPIIQSWSVAEGEGEAESYSIYAASNAGALLALLSYPFLIEPKTELQTQIRCWQGLYSAYAGLHWLCLPGKSAVKSDEAVASASPNESSGSGLVWFLLALGPSATMLATTNLLTLDFAAVPLLWILPLAIYLSTFILNFKKEPWYPQRLSMTIVLLMVGWLALVLVTVMFSADFAQKWVAIRRLWAVNKLTYMSASLFIVCMICHRALAQSKPAGRSSARYYAWIGAGGWAGSVLIGVVLPWLGRRIAMPELDWAIAGLLSMGALVYRDRKKRAAASPDLYPKLNASVATLFTALVLMGAGFGFYVNRSLAFKDGTIFSLRNFYGYYRVSDFKGFRYFFHGNTMHGCQYLDPTLQDRPVVYYYPGSPIAEFLRLEKTSVKKIGVAGLGAGVLAIHGFPGQTIDFYELDPDVAAIARKYFVFLKDSPAKVRIHTGDARLALLRDANARYDLLILDAFTGGAIPVHLLTKEALELYQQRLEGEGLIAFHITNRFLNLRPMLSALAKAEGLSGAAKKANPVTRPTGEEYYSSWVVLSKDSAKLKPLLAAGWEDLAGMSGATRPWTDQYASLWAALGN